MAGDSAEILGLGKGVGVGGGGGGGYEAETERLYLEKMSIEKHLLDYHAIFSDPRTESWSGRVPFTDIAQSRTKMEPGSWAPERHWVSNYAVLLKPSPDAAESTGPLRMIGGVGVLRRILIIPDGEQAEENRNKDEDKKVYEYELGYGFHPDFVGKGYGLEAVKAFLDLYWKLPERKHVSALTAIVDSVNEPSWKLLLKVGGVKDEGDKAKRDVKDHLDADAWIIQRPGLAISE